MSGGPYSKAVSVSGGLEKYERPQVCRSLNADKLYLCINTIFIPPGDDNSPFENKGVGVPRDKAGKYPPWATIPSRPSEADVKAKCTADDNCVAYFMFDDGNNQVFCKEKKTICNIDGNGGDATALKGSGTQGSNPAMVKKAPGPSRTS